MFLREEHTFRDMRGCFELVMNGKSSKRMTMGRAESTTPPPYVATWTSDRPCDVYALGEHTEDETEGRGVM
jgi:hypothetical protein